MTKLADEVPNLVGFRISPDVQHPEPTEGALDLETDANFLSLPVHGRRAGKFERSYPPSGGSVRAITFDGQVRAAPVLACFSCAVLARPLRARARACARARLLSRY